MKYKVSIEASRTDFEKIRSQSTLKSNFMAAIRPLQASDVAILTVVPIHGRGEFYSSMAADRFQNLLDEGVFPEAFRGAFENAVSAAESRCTNRGILEMAFDAVCPKGIILDHQESRIKDFDQTYLVVRRFNS